MLERIGRLEYRNRAPAQLSSAQFGWEPRTLHLKTLRKARLISLNSIAFPILFSARLLNSLLLNDSASVPMSSNNVTASQKCEAKVDLDGFPHEKTDVNVVNSLKGILDPPSSLDTLKKLHEDDAGSKWFGVERSDHPHPVTGLHQPVFRNYGRYATLMAESRPSNGCTRYPQLVSFIGQTSNGDSTSDFPSPVVGASRHDNLPTSGDVHLYADPSTVHSQFPMLYADCEGLDGGEQAPLANQALKNTAPHPSEEVKRLVIGGAKKVLEWAKDDVTSGREYAVKHLYPRLLFTFSDVIVFVLRNPKAFESVALKLLLDWAASSLEKSLNQPILSHAIVVLNATDLQVHEDEWDVEKATKNLMEKIKHAVDIDPVFRKYKELWRQKGKKIKTMEDLIKCYYSSISVVRIPGKGRYMLINDQLGKLHDRIIHDCDAAFSARQRVRMLPHADELNEYLEAGFNHFSKRLDVPFNFVEIAVRNHPVPQNFGDHVSNLAADMQQKHEYDNATLIFEELSPFVASCLLLDAVRGRRPGNLMDFFNKYYSNMCKAALDRFCDMFWPCSFRDSRGRACRNMRAGHLSKGHQDRNGRIIGSRTSGQYESNFSRELYQKKWLESIKRHLEACDARLQQKRQTIEDIGGGRRIPITSRGSSTCYCCLMKVPEHPLPCGHVLCTDCVKSYGKKLEHSSVMIRFKPDFAGVRVLSLDGGGIRGIIELEVLRAIERAMGGRIPVQRFFDLIVGTSTGGIIALGIGAKHWSIRTSTEKFSSLCDQAFTPRELSTVKVINKAVTLRHGSKYKTRPLHRALNTAFGEQFLFGGEQETDTAYMTKVAVTTTSGTGQSPIILSNYGRKDEPRLNYQIEFSLGSRLGLKVWEAAAATSAAPSFFKPFVHPNADRKYLDGALYFNNPIKIANNERKLLWPEVADCHPDLMLSIGTGQNQEETEAGVSRGARSQNEIEKRKMAKRYGKTDAAEKKQTSRPRRVFRAAGNAKNFFSVLVNRMESTLDSELAWRDFVADIFGANSSDVNCQRYIRLNPDLKSDVPSIDAKKGLKSLQDRTVDELSSSANKRLIRSIAHRLIASSFYFEKMAPKEVHASESFVCSGMFLCRFETGTTEVRELGRYLKGRQERDFQPHFLIRDAGDKSECRIMLTPEKLNTMIDRGVFDLGQQDIKISSRQTSTTVSLSFAEYEQDQQELYCISGFPRTLVIEDSAREEQLERRRTAVTTKRPPIRMTTSAPANLKGETLKTQERLSSDSGIPRLKQIIQNMLLPPEPTPTQTPTSSSKKPSLINLLDDEPPNPRSPTQNLSALSSLTPDKFGHAQPPPTSQSQNLSDLSSLTPEKNSYTIHPLTRPTSLPTTLPSSRLDVKEPEASDNGTQHAPSRDTNDDDDDSYSDDASEIYFRKGYGDDDLEDLSDYEVEEQTGPAEREIVEGKSVTYETHTCRKSAWVRNSLKLKPLARS
ncbi:hypothetical protein N431DRAFT_542623 [Stipitochalara longipes BDJ]|nr:hypothetical protein N431DRAFT_542623 [Stipitochalara longipes BDJ]